MRLKCIWQRLRCSTQPINEVSCASAAVTAWECASRAAKRAGLAARAELLCINPGDQEGKNSARNFDSFCKEVKSVIKHEIGS